MDTNEYVIEVSEKDFFHQVVDRSNTVSVVVDFWAPWCAPCRLLGPLLEKLAAEAKGAFVLAKVNVDENPNLAAEYGIRGIPAVRAFREGRVVAEFTGNQTEARVRNFLRQVAPTAADRAMLEAESLLATRHWAQAETAFREVLADWPNKAAAVLGLVKALLAQGKGEEALQWLENFPDGDEIAAAERLKPLAQLMAQVATQPQPEETDELAALYYHSARLLSRGQWAAGMDGLLEVLRQDRKYRRGEPRQVMIGVFDLLGDDDPLTSSYRSELASVLF